MKRSVTGIRASTNSLSPPRSFHSYRYINVIWFVFHFMAMASASTNPFVYAIYSVRSCAAVSCRDCRFRLPNRSFSFFHFARHSSRQSPCIPMLFSDLLFRFVPPLLLSQCSAATKLTLVISTIDSAIGSKLQMLRIPSDRRPAAPTRPNLWRPARSRRTRTKSFQSSQNSL